MRHGLCSAIESLAPEESAFFEGRLAALVAQHRPADAMEAHWVERMAWAMLRERRLDAIEAQVTAAAMGGEEEEPAARLPSLATVLRYRARLERDWKQAAGELALARARREAAGARAPQGTHARPVAAGEPPAAALSRGGTNGPEPAPAASLNRAQRRRMEARLRHRKAA